MGKSSNSYRKLAAYTAGTMGTIAMSPMLNATLVIQNLDLTLGSGVNDYLSLDTFADGAGTITVNLAGVSSASDNLRMYSGGGGIYFEGENYNGIDLQMFYVLDGGRRLAINADAGDTVTAASGTATQNFTDVANGGRTFKNGFADDTRDYTGFQLEISGRTHYGWLDFTPHNNQTMTIHRFALQTTASTGALITAVPEPAHTAAIFAAGAAGLAILRRRKADNKETL